MTTAISTLQIALQNAEHNESVFRNAGDTENADHARQSAESINEGLAALQRIRDGDFKQPDSFAGKIALAINHHSLEAGSDTPDFILAEYLKRCLENFDLTMQHRATWFEKEGDEVFGVEPQQEYRMLEAGEVIQPGDEIHPKVVTPPFARNDAWQPLKGGTVFIGSRVGQSSAGIILVKGGFRRPI